MSKRVLDVGNCAADHGSIRALLERSFDVSVDQAHSREQALDQMRAQPYDLVLVNRRLDRDDSQGLEIIRDIKSDDRLSATPVMMITNFPDHQESAVAAGAERGFGKSALQSDATRQMLAQWLQDASA